MTVPPAYPSVIAPGKATADNERVGASSRANYPPRGVQHGDMRIGPRTRELILGTSSCPSLVPPGISLVGTSEARPGFSFERPLPGFVQVLACLAGEGEVLINGEWQRCQRGQAYITPQRVHHFYRAVRRSVWKLVWVQYDEEAVTIDGPPMLKTVDAPLLESTFLGLYREQNAAADHAVLASWTHLLDTTARRTLAPQVHDPRMSELWETIAGDLSRVWALEDMAQVAGLSPEHLRRLCHATFHRSPTRHLTYLRMRHAFELLAVSDEKIETIGRQVGYDNAFAFSVAFKREIGMPPSSCRGSRAG
jgi:AraC-like DNA-binding protein